jgi:hypothetical protein
VPRPHLTTRELHPFPHTSDANAKPWPCAPPAIEFALHCTAPYVSTQHGQCIVPNIFSTVTHPLVHCYHLSRPSARRLLPAAQSTSATCYRHAQTLAAGLALCSERNFENAASEFCSAVQAPPPFTSSYITPSHPLPLFFIQFLVASIPQSNALCTHTPCCLQDYHAR